MQRLVRRTAVISVVTLLLAGCSTASLSSRLGSQFQRADSAEEMKVAVATYRSSSAARMQQLADEIGSIDPSAVSGGKTIQQEIMVASWSNIGGLQTALTQVQALDTSDEEEMKAGLLEIVKDTQAAPLDVQLRLGAFGAPALDRAFRHARGCDTVA